MGGAISATKSQPTGELVDVVQKLYGIEAPRESWSGATTDLLRLTWGQRSPLVFPEAHGCAASEFEQWGFACMLRLEDEERMALALLIEVAPLVPPPAISDRKVLSISCVLQPVTRALDPFVLHETASLGSNAEWSSEGGTLSCKRHRVELDAEGATLWLRQGELQLSFAGGELLAHEEPGLARGHYSGSTRFGELMGGYGRAYAITGMTVTGTFESHGRLAGEAGFLWHTSSWAAPRSKPPLTGASLLLLDAPQAAAHLIGQGGACSGTSARGAAKGAAKGRWRQKQDRMHLTLQRPYELQLLQSSNLRGLHHCYTVNLCSDADSSLLVLNAQSARRLPRAIRHLDMQPVRLTLPALLTLLAVTVLVLWAIWYSFGSQFSHRLSRPAA